MNLGVVEDIEAFETQRPGLERLGFLWKGQHGVLGRRYCVLHNAEGTVGYLHFHTFHRRHPTASVHILFRDYLRAFDEKASQYEKLKDTLAVTHASERDKYTSAKDALMQTLLREAQVWKLATDPNARVPVRSKYSNMLKPWVIGLLRASNGLGRTLRANSGPV